ncbi:uncharacterized protein LOC101848583 [Aplysia californica]|uniref:Uncharacterized protein LOC101848583 n=1 Tax=Aplysia californica TaxID=6500 RepID=A0ABM0ZYJ7_APLCA|nr:uncharacterized protein LOC101848583 [Aplysia californica]
MTALDTIKRASAIYNFTPEETEFYSSFVIPVDLHFVVEIATTVGNAFLVAGVSANLVAIGICNAKAFRGTAFAIYAKILLFLNIILLCLVLARHQMFLLDWGQGHILDRRRSTCVNTNWFYYLADHCLAASTCLLGYNRINAQRGVDYFRKPEDAMRWPVMVNVILWLLATVPVSKYAQNRHLTTRLFNRTECSFALRKPFCPSIPADWILANLPLLEDFVLIFILVFLTLEVVLKRRRQKRQQGLIQRALSSSTSSYVDCLEQGSFTKTRRRSGKQRDGNNLFGESSMTRSESLNLSESTITDDEEDIQIRVASVTGMTVALIVVYTLLRLPRDLLLSTEVAHYLSGSALAFYEMAKSRMDILLLVELVNMASLCLPLLIFYVFGSAYRREAKMMLFEVRIAHAHSEMSLSTATRVMNTLLRKPTSVFCPASRHDVSGLGDQGSYHLVLETLSHHVSLSSRQSDIFNIMSKAAGSEETMVYLEKFPTSDEMPKLTDEALMRQVNLELLQEQQAREEEEEECEVDPPEYIRAQEELSKQTDEI